MFKPKSVIRIDGRLGIKKKASHNKTRNPTLSVVQLMLVILTFKI